MTPQKCHKKKETKGPRRLYTKVEYVDPSAVRRPHRKSAATARPAGARSESKTAGGRYRHGVMASADPQRDSQTPSSVTSSTANASEERRAASAANGGSAANAACAAERAIRFPQSTTSATTQPGIQIGARARRAVSAGHGFGVTETPDVGAPLATRVLCAGRGVWCSYRPKFEIGVVELLARKGNSLSHRGLRARGRLVGEPRCPSSAIPRNLEQADLGRSTPPLATLVYTETKMSTHKHSEAGNELRSLSMIRYDQSMNATTQISKDSHFWHLTPLPAHRQVHTSHTPTSGVSRSCRRSGSSMALSLVRLVSGLVKRLSLAAVGAGRAQSWY